MDTMDQSATKIYQRVLSIAGSDSGGGAGIQADIKTISANGCYAMTVITALTAQNTLGVQGIHPVPVSFVIEQLHAVLSDIGTNAVKIGMLFSPELIQAIAQTLREYGVENIVLDPVMVAQSGDALLQNEAVAALKEELIPLATLITPNLPEAGVLLGWDRNIKTLADMEFAARDLARLGCPYILIKGGHLEEEQDTDDHLYQAETGETFTFSGKRIATANNHGTGCTLSSAIAAGLAKGEHMVEAVTHAKAYISEAIAAGASYKLGQGHGPVHHFYALTTR